ncbi:28427_t:CDS:2 [Gigaspora margarita]|uniref:Bola-like protein n=2 Tax=Gigaspora margarita TaxID=4874 RepID=A0A8H3XB03_GIGMA|nr:bola-like protein [Gigaspora margarita]CAG8667716.1 28427_t:CDS:2 [Gigaspora margarita]
MSGISKELLEQTLRKKLEAEYVEVVDTSGGCGQSYDVIIVSKIFEGKSVLQKHQLVNETCKSEIAQLHAFSQKSYTPAQWEAQKQKQTS